MLMPEDVEACCAVLREYARPDYLVHLLLPEEIRSNWAVLRAFHSEIVAIPFKVSEPMPGEIRLQWWRDVIAGERAGEAAAHPLARALLALIEKDDLQRTAIDAKLEAHVFDLYSDPMPDRNTFQGYAGETRSILYRLAVQKIEDEDDPAIDTALADAAGHAGVVELLAETLISFPRHRAFKRIFIPADMMKAAGVSNESYLAGDTVTEAGSLIKSMIENGMEHLVAARNAARSLSPIRRAIFCRLAYSEAIFNNALGKPKRILTEGVQISPLKAQWVLWRAARRGGV